MTAVEITDDGCKVLAKRIAGRDYVLMITPCYLGSSEIRRLLNQAEGRCLDCVSVSSKLSLEEVERLVEQCCQAEVLVAIGGGTTIDVAKLSSCGFAPNARNLGGLRDGMKPELKRAIPILAVPTTAGSGSEVTPFATIWDWQSRRKYSLENKCLVPEVAVLDPSFSLRLPIEPTISAGLDAIAQALDSVCSKNANKDSFALCLTSLRRTLPTLPNLLKSTDDRNLRSEMLLGSCEAGAAIAQTRTGMAHAISYPLTAHFGVPHGLACGFALDLLTKAYLPKDDGRLAELSRGLGFQKAEELVHSLRYVNGVCNTVSRVSAYGVRSEDLLSLSDEMQTPGRSDNVAFPFSRDELKAVLRNAL